MKPLTWSLRNAVPHPPLMLERLATAMKLSRPWRDALSLSEHLCRRAVQEGDIAASPKERSLLGLPPDNRRGRRTRKSIDGSALVPAVAAAPEQQVTRLVTFDVLDCTFGAGHHSAAILAAGAPYSRVVALDADASVVRTARGLYERFGRDRFRFFNNRMSAALAMFGEEAFDMIVIDPGFNATQIFDPARGFALDDSETSFDLRYSADTGTTALQWLNCEDLRSAAGALSATQHVSFSEAHRMMAALRRARPLTGSRDVLSILTAVGGALPEDGWITTDDARHLPPSMRFLRALCTVINNELGELRSILQGAMLLLKKEGQVAAFTRFPWESALLSNELGRHPYSLPVFSEKIDSHDVEEYGFPPTTTLHVFRRTSECADIMRNSIEGISREQRQESAGHHLFGLDATSEGRFFPSCNFTFKYVDPSERKVIRSNEQPPTRD